MNTPEVERAAELLLDGRSYVGGSASDWASNAARALHAANLLRTEADRLNAELAEAYVAHREATHGYRIKEAKRLDDAYEAVHEHRNPKPVERWTLGDTHGAPTVLRDGSVYHVLPVGFEPEARAYVARKNMENK